MEGKKNKEYETERSSKEGAKLERTSEAESMFRTFQDKSCGGIKLKG